MSDLALSLILKAKKEHATYLDLGRCGLTELPAELFDLTEVETLILSDRWWDWRQQEWIGSRNTGKPNRLRNLPNEIGRLQKMHALMIAGDWNSNWEICDLKPLEKLTAQTLLDFSSNHVSDLKPILPLIEKGIKVKIEGYDGIVVGNNPLSSPPSDIVEQGNEDILRYFRQIEEQEGTEPLHEAKFIIVGEPGAGKTSLMKKLFLTPSALYVLVADDRRQNTNFPYCLEIIHLLGREGDYQSPILVFLNENQHRSVTNHDHNYFKQTYPTTTLELAEADVFVNDYRFKALRGKIQHVLCNLRHVGNRLPKKWRPIREELFRLSKEEKRNHINEAEYASICSKHHESVGPISVKRISSQTRKPSSFSE